MTINFVSGATYPSGGTDPDGIAVADFDGDGKLDVAVADRIAGTLSVFLNNGDGSLKSPLSSTVPTTTVFGPLSVGDFNEDHKPDLIASVDSGDVVFLGNGDGTFQQLPPIPNSAGFLQVRVTDLNGDHHPDLVFGGSGNIAVSLGRGDGTFTDAAFQTTAALPATYFGIVVADFNGDGKLDIAASDYGYSVGKLAFYAGKGDGTFQDPTVVDLTASFPSSLETGDFNGDGKQDLLIGFPNNGLIVKGLGDGTFDLANPTFVYSTSNTDFTMAVNVLAADVDGDGKMDVITADSKLGVLQITTNKAIGKSAPSDGIFSFTLSPGIYSTAAGDLNGDGVLDVVAANYQTGEITTVLSKKQ